VEFTEAVEAAVATILKDPGRYQPVGEGIRTYRLRRFPYQIFFRYHEQGQDVRIVAVMHQRRLPDYWRARH
jgi:plasmid stabilization system protein ParE